MNKRILVTRPKTQASTLIQALTDQGDIPVSLPLLDIQPFNETSPVKSIQIIKQRVLSVDQYPFLIFISTNAVDCGFFWLNHYSVALTSAERCFAIGEATRKRLEDHGIHADTQGIAMNSESLLQAADLQHLEGKKVLIVRGRGGREYLREELEKRGAHVDYLEVYQRQVLQYPVGTLSGILDQKITFITLSSGETIQQLLHQAMIEGESDKVLSIPVIVPGERLYQLAMSKGFGQVLKAENASVNSILQVIKHQQ